MGEFWDYELRNMEMAWELAKSVIPAHPEPQGAWMESTYSAGNIRTKDISDCPGLSTAEGKP